MASFKLSLTGWRGQKTKGRILSVFLISAIAGGVGALGYAIAAPKAGEKFTEFYILGLEGKATDYHQELTVEEEGRVTVGVINHEHREITYRVEVTINYIKDSEMGPVTLGHDEKWESTASFAPTREGDNQRVEFLLYRLDQNDVYQRLHLWIDVTAP